MGKETKEKIIESFEDEKEYIIDLGSLTVMAKSEREAEEKAVEQIANCDVEIDQIILNEDW